MAVNAITTAMQTTAFMETLWRSYRCIRLAKSFERDYDTCLIRLDIACLNLDFWNKLHPSEESLGAARNPELLADINDIFKQANGLMQNYGYRASDDLEAQSSVIHEYELEQHMQTTASATAINLHNHIQEQQQDRPMAPTFGRRVSWVLSGYEELDKVVGLANDLVTKLSLCYPPERGSLNKEREHLVNAIKSEEELKLLKDATRDTDEALHLIASGELPVLEGHTIERLEDAGQENTYGNCLAGRSDIPPGRYPGGKINHIEYGGTGNVMGNRF